MPRRTRFRLAEVPQHIVQRGNNRQPTFFCDSDYLVYLACLRDAARKYECLVHAYVLMTNHVHMLASARTPDGLSRMMQHLGRRFVGYINQGRGRTGTLWEGRYRASLVDSERYFLCCCRYIDLNPVRAGLVQHPGLYRWSSYRHHAHGAPDDVVTDHEEYTRLGLSADERQVAYRTLFTTGIGATALAAIREAARRGWPLGSEAFKDGIERALVRPARPPKRGRRNAPERGRPSVRSAADGQLRKSDSDPDLPLEM